MADFKNFDDIDQKLGIRVMKRLGCFEPTLLTWTEAKDANVRSTWRHGTNGCSCTLFRAAKRRAADQGDLGIGIAT